MTNREYILKCISEMSDQKLHSLWLVEFDGEKVSDAIKDRCSYCKFEAENHCPCCDDIIPIEDYMSREVEFVAD